MQDDLYDGLRDEVEEGVRILLERGWTPYRVLTEALVAGMTIVGADFRDGILFVPEVLLAANAMKAGMAILKPLLAETGAPKVGKMVIGTVKGDIHDIGKNLVGMMMEGAGFEVVDLGINCDVDKYLNALEQHKPDILGMSALLTTTMPYMKVVVDAMIEKGIRNDYVVLVGGAPLNEAFANSVGADAYCRDAAVAVETAKAVVEIPSPQAGRIERLSRNRPDIAGAAQLRVDLLIPVIKAWSTDIGAGSDRRERLLANSQRLRSGLQAAGFEVLGQPSAIVPVILGGSALSRLMTKHCLRLGGIVKRLDGRRITLVTCAGCVQKKGAA